MTDLTFRPGRRRRRVVLNLTSLIDVMFLLLIFFMLTSTFRRGELELDLPTSSTATPVTDAGAAPVELTLRADGGVLLNGVPVATSDLPAELSSRVAAFPQARVQVNAVAAARHSDVIRLLDLVRDAGFTGVGLGTELGASNPVSEETQR